MSIQLNRPSHVFSLCCVTWTPSICYQCSEVDLTDFPTSRLNTPDWQAECRTVLTERYSHLCLSDMAVKTALIDTGPRPFCLQCSSPWGGLCDATNAILRGNLINDMLIVTRVQLSTGKLRSAAWLVPETTRGGLRNNRR